MRTKQRAQHTPGPWSFSEIKSERQIVIENRAKGLQVSALSLNNPFVGPGSNRANARLIAAAPELLEALKSVRAAMMMHLEGKARFEVDQEGVDIVSRLIRKAEGGEE